ncbi:MAG: hypothetical protein GVY26_10700 [Bacteroidetes bacterium]|jgi:uncharacterized protein YbaP (TraB family)|nr:hypothetical protein [Bacteroidota bacterium]
MLSATALRYTDMSIVNTNHNQLLWRMHDAAGEGPVSFLFGTMHVRDQRAFRLLEKAYAAIDECEALALEFDLGAVEGLDPGLLQLPPGQTLDSLLPARKFQKLRRFLLRVLKVDIMAFRRALPLMTVNVLNERMMGQEQPIALDEQLWRYAQEQGKAILGIETYEEQVALLRSIPIEQQLQSLLWLGRNIKSHRRQLRKMTELYESGDIYRLHRAAKRSASGMRHRLLYRRNEIMAERIAAFTAERPVFCAVGAGHLAGGKGVLRLLKHQGITLKPVPLK